MQLQQTPMCEGQTTVHDNYLGIFGI